MYKYIYIFINTETDMIKINPGETFVFLDVTVTSD